MGFVRYQFFLAWNRYTKVKGGFRPHIPLLDPCLLPIPMSVDRTVSEVGTVSVDSTVSEVGTEWKGKTESLGELQLPGPSPQHS